MKISNKVLKLYTLIRFMTIIHSFNLDMIKNDTTISVFNNSTLNQFFSYNNDAVISSSCREKIVHYEFANNNITMFRSNSTIDNIAITASEDIVASSSLLNDEFTITHTCNEDFDNFWGIIEAHLTSQNETFSFQFIKFCDNPSMMGTLMTMCIIFTTATLVIMISTYSELKFEFTDMGEEGEIKNWHILIFIILGSGVLIMIFFLKDYINIVFTGIVLFQSTLAVYLTLKNLLDYSADRFVFLKEKVDIRCFRDIEIINLIVYIYTGVVMFTYILTRYWLLNNILGFSLVFTILSLFHIKNLKICSILLIGAFCYDVFWVYISPLIFTKNVMVIAATTMDLPIKFEFPILMFNHPLKSCMYLGLGDLVLPGFVIKFCRRFDFIKNINIYYRFSILLYIIALVCSALGITIFNYPQPVLFYMCPILLIGIGCVARKRKESEIWNADVLEDQIIEHMSIPENFTDIENSFSSDSTE
jgi:hypothetical protein